MLSAAASEILAVCVLGVLAAALLGRVIWMIRRSPFSPAQSLLYALNYVLVRCLWRTRIIGAPAIPPDRGAIFVCNHRCPLDPAFIALSVPRVIHWMVAREYCEYPPFRRLLRFCEAIPVRRATVDLAATRAAVGILRQGGLVGVLPEARINSTADLLLPAQLGAAWLALRAGVPIVPCYIHGAPYDGTTLGCLLKPAAVTLRIGQPIDVTPYLDRRADRKVLEELTRRLLCAIAELAGQPDYRPQISG
jgi:1-acyl-sn-glycerol-3-phosphate acyltransferase